MENVTAGPSAPGEDASSAILGNGRYHVFLTPEGAGYSAIPGIALTSWSPDPTELAGGFFLYLRDLGAGVTNRKRPGRDRPGVPDPGNMPDRSGAPGSSGERFHARWAPGAFEILREEEEIESTIRVCVHPEALLEIREITLRNTGARPRRIEVTSYIEVVLNSRAAHAAHPAFSKLFVETERVEGAGILLARRRPRSAGEAHPWIVHALLRNGDPGSQRVGDAGSIGSPAAVTFETDRARFLGRCRTPRRPLAMEHGYPLWETTGPVLDPIFCLRRALDLDPGASGRLVFVLGAGEDRDATIDQIRELEAPAAIEAVFAAAAGREARLLASLGVSEQEARRFNELAGGILTQDPDLRRGARCATPGEAVADLAALGVSPEAPLIVADAWGPKGAELIRSLTNAQAYWSAQGLTIQTIILTDGPPPSALPSDASGLRVLRYTDLSETDRRGLEARADLFLCDEMPAPPARPRAAARGGSARGALPGAAGGEEREHVETRMDTQGLHFFNGYGGFTGDGREYVTAIRHHRGLGHVHPPRPWINVIANERFGFLVSERGSISTWSRNSRLHRLTPWPNDPLADPISEAFYLRDEESGEFWSLFPGPTPAAADYEVRHGFGYTRCAHTSHGLEQRVVACAAREARLQIATVRVSNRAGRARRLAAWSYRRLVLGTLPEHNARFIVTEARLRGSGDGRSTDSSQPRESSTTSAAHALLLATNPYAGAFADGVVFAAVVEDGPAREDPAGKVPTGAAAADSASFTTDRRAFLGPLGSPEAPAALVDGGPLDQATGAGLDPCFTQRVPFILAPGEERTIAFLFGEADSPEEAAAMAARYEEEAGATARAPVEAHSFWADLLGGLTIHTPEPALDMIVNGWLAYQTLSCRIWARSALYQSGGAFGYRDQIQDAAALLHYSPAITREQILLHAAHQFVEGDVLHWWHPPEDIGIRTRFADDLLWLPYVTSDYVRRTGDAAILDETVSYLTARALRPGEDEAYLKPSPAGQTEDLYGHCCRAIDRSLATGPHGLPLFGTGDWNDGMNRVGREGKGESVWMGFFLDAVLGDFLPLVGKRGDRDRADRYASFRARLREALNDTGWDGAWYRRAYYDDGSPLGSRASDECRIDGLVQAWAVISGAAPPERAKQAMDAVERELVFEADGLIRLLTPPFDRTPHDPGYIKGYPPGVRENGGQYTHAALWMIRAFAILRRRDRVADLLRMLSPITRTATPVAVGRYQAEPYVIAADVYGEPPHVGRGGWSWYTGSAGWMIRVVIESLLGFGIEAGETITLRPCVPDAWPGFTIVYRIPGTSTWYRIEARRNGETAEEVTGAELDGAPVPIREGVARIPILRDGATHGVVVTLGASRNERGGT